MVESPFGWGTNHANVSLERNTVGRLKRRRGVPLRRDYGISGSGLEFADALGSHREGRTPRLVKCVLMLRRSCLEARERASKSEPQTQQQNQSHRLHCTDFERICRFESMAHGRSIRQSDSRRQNRFTASGEIRILWTDDSGTERVS